MIGRICIHILDFNLKEVRNLCSHFLLLHIHEIFYDNLGKLQINFLFEMLQNGKTKFNGQKCFCMSLCSNYFPTFHSFFSRFSQPVVSNYSFLDLIQLQAIILTFIINFIVSCHKRKIFPPLS